MCFQKTFCTIGYIFSIMANLTYTIDQFRKDYPNDAACLDAIFKKRYGDMKCCPKCDRETQFKRISTRRSYQCRLCYHQIYPTAGTVFENTRTPLTYWFYAIFLFTVTRNGVSAKELQRQLGVTYKTAWRMGHHIRLLMGDNSGDMLDGVVEMDEMFARTGGESEQPGRTTENKTPVFGMVERLGKVRAFAVPDTKKLTLFPIIKDHVNKDAQVYTDEWLTYKNLGDAGFKHEVVSHSLGEYVKGSISTNTIEGFWSQVKRTIGGTHLCVSRKYLQLYIDECCFRYNNREIGNEMFFKLLNQV